MAIILSGASPVDFGNVEEGVRVYRTLSLHIRPEGGPGAVAHMNFIVNPVGAALSEFGPIFTRVNGVVTEQPGPGAVAVDVTDDASQPDTVLDIFLPWTPGGGHLLGSTYTIDLGAGPSAGVAIDGNRVARTALALQMVLDRSGSMSEDADPGAAVTPKIELLQTAALTCGRLLTVADNLGALSFDNVVETVFASTNVSSGTYTGKLHDAFEVAASAANHLSPRGSTAIGDGLFAGDATLAGLSSVTFPKKALLLATDGMENTGTHRVSMGYHPASPTFVVGIGIDGVNVDGSTLGAASGSTGGYPLITGPLDTAKRFLLEKFFLSIVADASGFATLSDPEGTITPGRIEAVPFWVTHAESSLDVILLNRAPDFVRFFLLTPGGELILPSTIAPGIEYVTSSTVSFYRLRLPALPSDPAGSYVGKWTALIALTGKEDELVTHRENGRAEVTVKRAKQSFQQLPRGVPYSLIVHGRSGLVMSPLVHQQSHLPGSTAVLSVTLKEFDVLVGKDRAHVEAIVTFPDGSKLTLPLHEKYPGRYRAELQADAIGTYQILFRAAGKTQFESRFEREALRTATISLGSPSSEIPPSELGGATGSGNGAGSSGNPSGTPGGGACECCACRHPVHCAYHAPRCHCCGGAK